MTFVRSLASALTFTLAASVACAANVPASLAGEWFTGAQYPADVYTTDLTRAASSASRLLVEPGGTYVFTRFDSTHVASSFGFSGYPITCQVMNATVERGRLTVQGGRVTFKPLGVDTYLAYSPASLNNGCTRYAATKRSKPGGETDVATWTVRAGKLDLTFGKDTSTFVRRAPPPKPAPVDTGLDRVLRGEWQLGRVLPAGAYDPTGTVWTDAPASSARLTLRADRTYDRVTLLVEREYGCNPRRLTTEQGQVMEKGRVLTFTPRTSVTVTQTCEGKIETSRNTVGPYQETYAARVGVTGREALVLTSKEDELVFVRPAAPEGSAPPATTGAASRSAPVPAPAQRTASGTWDAVVTVGDASLRVRVELQDDSPRVIGFGDAPVLFANGDSATGTLNVGLDLDGRTFELGARGRFDGDRYQGEGEWKLDGETLGRGTLTMTRR
ncbi:hypothetical protein [Deinococcus pimensis]|uniref:hypothetical protein n=1 Tax=Deinococcus pimensis TaxID=309888 RepID=UPI0004880BBB|nr:hypothetical protein [Deinococcus pimensis]